MGNPEATVDVMVIRVVTRFTTTEQFVAGFQQLCTETTCFIPTHHGKQIGIETGFSIRLADGTPMLRGLCVVDEVWTTGDNPYKRPGVMLSIRCITVDSRAVFEQIQLARLASVQTAAPCAIMLPSDTIPNEAPQLHVSLVVDATPTIEMVPLFGIETVNDEADPSQRMTAGLTIPIARPPLSTILGVSPLIQPRPLGPGPVPVVVTSILDGPSVTALVRTAPPPPVPRGWWSGISTAARAATAFIARLIAPLRRRQRRSASRPYVRRPRVVMSAITKVRDPSRTDTR